MANFMLKDFAPYYGNSYLQSSVLVYLSVLANYGIDSGIESGVIQRNVSKSDAGQTLEGVRSSPELCTGDSGGPFVYYMRIDGNVNYTTLDGSATHAQQMQSEYRAIQLSALSTYLPFDYDQADYDSCSENWSMSKMKWWKPIARLVGAWKAKYYKGFIVGLNYGNFSFGLMGSCAEILVDNLVLEIYLIIS